MVTTIQITTDNYDGQTAVITYYPDTGGTINLGSQILPYDYNSNYFYGTYSLYFPLFDTTCTLVIPNQTPTPSATITPTPTITPTMTPTPTPVPTKQYYVYKLCGDGKVAYVVQTQPGLTTTPGKVIKTTLDEYCWEFLYQTTNPNPIPPAPFVQIINFDGDYLTPVSDVIYDDCTSCSSPSRCVLVTFTIVGGVNQYCNNGDPSYGHAAVEWTDCNGNPLTHTFGGSSPGTQFEVCALTNGYNNVSAGQPDPAFICGSGTVSISLNECPPCITYNVVGPRTISYRNCEGISQTVIIPSGDSLEICSRSIIGGATQVGPC